METNDLQQAAQTTIAGIDLKHLDRELRETTQNDCDRDPADVATDALTVINALLAGCAGADTAAGAPALPGSTHDQHQLAAQRDANDAAARASTVRQFGASSAMADNAPKNGAVPAKAGSPSAPRMALHPNEHARLMQQAAHLTTPPVIERPQPELTFDKGELQPGELYAGIVSTGGIFRHLILLPAEAHAVSWQQARTFAAAVGGELPDLGDYEVLRQNLQHEFAGDDAYWSCEGLINNNTEALYLDFGIDPFRDWDSVDALMRARAVRRTFAGREQSILVDWHKHIKTMREAARVTVDRMAELMNVTPDVIERWESGEVRTIPGPVLAEVCSVLNIDGGWLLGADDE